MTDGEGYGNVPLQQAEASGNSQVTQVAGDYEEHHHRYVRGWEYLRGARVDDAEMDLVDNAFVDPPGPNGTGQVAAAASRLTRPYDRNQILVICAEAGAGRRTAALRVLRNAKVPRDKILWLLLDWDQPRTEQIPYTENHGFVLDLTGYRTLTEDFYTGLADYQKDAEANSAFLVILADPGAWNPGTLTAAPSVPLVRPPAPQVAKAHLAYLSAGREDWLNSPPLDTLLAPAAPAADAAHLARLIARAKGNDRAAVKEEFTDWHDHLENWFDKHSQEGDLRERALLLAAALLEGVPADVVLAAADRLFTEVGGQLPPGGALAGRDLGKRLESIHARQVAGEGISLEAEQHGLPAAVLKYVWQQRPQLRPVLLEWASQISAPNGIAVRHLRRIADCLVQLSLLPGGATVRSVASTWIETDRIAHRQLAIEILETMALHPVTGVATRKQLYDWAHQKTTSKELIRAVGEICAGQLGRKYPRVALTRLRLLATRGDDDSLQAVTDAVRTLAAAPEQHTLVLSEIIGWAESADTKLRMAGTSTFLALAEVGDIHLLLPGEQESADDLRARPTGQLFVRGWRAALQEPAIAEAAHARLASWLDSPALPDQQVLPLAGEVLRGYIGQAGAAAVLVGSSSSSDVGRSRRRRLLDQLILEHAATPSGHAPAPGSGSASLSA
ncbi:hypothetical protein [Streptomyces sp. SCL15-6]|uniref:hypothetical protein n=1 Tax=Streptomyces sp. SCL15-6 TaxID=2967222 RepID=UPI0029662940|nr:hypothetical protein [Streptomyces sp. SCL15-6]